MSIAPETANAVLDQAARAGWLYYVGGLTQDQIARELGVSRQRAQRLVSRAVAEKLIQVRLEHPIAACLDLESALVSRYGLRLARVAPRLDARTDPVRAIAPVAATEMERVLSAADPLIIALGTGRTLRAVVEELTKMECEHHRIVSLNGSIGPDGAASMYDVIMRIADKVRAPHYPMPVPVICEDPQERSDFYKLRPVRNVAAMAAAADVTIVGVGQMADDAPLLKDGFLGRAELEALQNAGAVGEIVGWIYDSEGRYLETGINERVGGVRVPADRPGPVIGIGGGTSKHEAIRGALKGRILNGLITDEETANFLIS